MGPAVRDVLFDPRGAIRAGVCTRGPVHRNGGRAPARNQDLVVPGERAGYEFVYPKDQARRLAQRASEPVLTTETASTATEQTNTADLIRISSAGEGSRVNADAAPTPSTPGGTNQQGAVAPAGLSIASATIPVRLDVGPSPATTPPQSRRASLPQTASPLPIVSFVACLALCAGAALGAWRRARV